MPPNLAQQIKEKSRERKTVKAEKKSLPAWQVFKHKELAAKIAALTEDLEELRSEKAVRRQRPPHRYPAPPCGGLY